MLERLSAHPPVRRLLLVSIALPVVAMLAVLAFAWPAARVEPRAVPVGIVGTGAASQHAVEALIMAAPGAFDLHLYADEATARSAIDHRDVDGAFVITPRQVTVLDAGAAGPVLAQVLSGTGRRLGAQSSLPVRTVDVVPLSSDDARGSIFAASLLPLIISGLLMAAMIAVLVRLRPAWRQLLALVVASSLVGLGAYLIAQGFLGALPGQGLATWAALALTVFAIGATAAGLAELLGPVGLGLAAVLMVFIGNPFSGITSAPELLPDAVHRIGQLLPPGAAAGLVRSTAYFDGHGAGGHVAVLAGWAVLGIAAIVAGHRRAATAATTADAVAAAAEAAETAGGQHEAPPRHLVGAGRLHEAV